MTDHFKDRTSKPNLRKVDLGEKEIRRHIFNVDEIENEDMFECRQCNAPFTDDILEYQESNVCPKCFEENLKLKMSQNAENPSIHIFWRGQEIQPIK